MLALIERVEPMQEKRLDVAEKYTASIIWVPRFILNDPFGYNDFLADAKRYVVNITGCSPEKFDELKDFGFMEFIFDPQDQLIVECFWQFVDSIRMARQ